MEKEHVNRAFNIIVGSFEMKYTGRRNISIVEGTFLLFYSGKTENEHFTCLN